MKIGKYPVKHSFKPARIISDVLSLIITAVIFLATVNFFPRYREALMKASQENLYEILIYYGHSLTYRHYWAWIFPALAVIVFAVYFILTLKSHRFRKLKITNSNAQAVYDWYAFSVSLCKIPLLMGIFDMMYGFQKRMMFEEASLFSFQLILEILMVVIIIRLTIHRLRKITEVKITKAEDDSPIKVKIREDDD